jgi:hypothetical protein
VARLAVLALLMLVVAVPTGTATTLPSMIVRVNVALAPRTVTLSAKQVRRGNYVEFKVKNGTTRQRKFSVAGRTIVVPAKKYRLLAISFDVRGKYRYVSRGTGSVVRGTFLVN